MKKAVTSIHFKPTMWSECITPNSYVEIFTPQVMVLWDESLDAIRLWGQSHHMDSINTFTRRCLVETPSFAT